jgi:hypothetical protein
MKTFLRVLSHKNEWFARIYKRYENAISPPWKNHEDGSKIGFCKAQYPTTEAAP